VADTLGDYPSFPRVQVMAQTTSGTLGPPVAYPADQPAFLRTADVDGDGRTDLVTAQSGTHVGVLLQQGNGTLGPEQPTAVNFSTRIGLVPVAVGDISGDGRPDVVIADSNKGLMVVRNATPATPPNLAPQSPYSVWSQPGGPSLDGIGDWVVPTNVPTAEPGQLPPTYVYGHVFGFADSPATGTVALLRVPSGRFAVFSVIETNGTPHTAIVPFNWAPNRFYFLFVYQLSPGSWGAWVYDHTGSTWTTIGALSLPAGWGKLSPTSTTVVWWAGPLTTRCSLYPSADVFFAPPTGFVGTTATQATPIAFLTSAGGCPPRSSIEGGWVHDALGSARP